MKTTKETERKIFSEQKKTSRFIQNLEVFLFWIGFVLDCCVDFFYFFRHKYQSCLSNRHLFFSLKY